jgi:hypothetical protein
MPTVALQLPESTSGNVLAARASRTAFESLRKISNERPFSPSKSSIGTISVRVIDAETLEMLDDPHLTDAVGSVAYSVVTTADMVGTEYNCDGLGTCARSGHCNSVFGRRHLEIGFHLRL